MPKTFHTDTGVLRLGVHLATLLEVKFYYRFKNFISGFMGVLINQGLIITEIGTLIELLTIRPSIVLV